MEQLLTAKRQEVEKEEEKEEEEKERERKSSADGGEEAGVQAILEVASS